MLRGLVEDGFMRLGDGRVLTSRPKAGDGSLRIHPNFRMIGAMLALSLYPHGVCMAGSMWAALDGGGGWGGEG